jgi:hypothetical protein
MPQIFDISRGCRSRTVCTAEEVAADFNAVADHPAFAMFANGCDGLDRTFEAVEGMPRARGNQFETLIVVIATNFALCHKKPPHLCLLIQNTFRVSRKFMD